MPPVRALSLVAQLTLAALTLAVPAPVQANGAFPAAGQILIDPSNETRMWVSTTYGFAKSNDSGKTFQLVCEAAIGYQGGFHPHAAITPTGAIFMGLPDGLAVGRGDTCDFERAADLQGSYVIDVSVDAVSGRAVALVQPPNGAEPYIAASDDDLASFAKLGSDLPEKFVALTLDAAPSDPSVLYVSGLIEGDPVRGALLTSVDGGQSWQASLVPESDPQTAPFIAAVDPLNAAKVYVRLNGAPGKLFYSDDSGATLTKILETKGFLHAFRLAPDGASAFFGGSLAGLHRLDTATLAQTPLAQIAARCVTIRDERVYACGDDASDGFSAGVSTDGAVSFQPVLQQKCIEGPLACDLGTAVNDSCEPGWPMVAELLGATDCTPGAGGGGNGAGAAGGSGPAAGGGAGGHGGSRDGAELAGGCGSCLTSKEKASDAALWLFGLLAVASIRRWAFNAPHDPCRTSSSSDWRRWRPRSRVCSAARDTRRKASLVGRRPRRRRRDRALGQGGRRRRACGFL